MGIGFYGFNNYSNLKHLQIGVIRYTEYELQNDISVRRCGVKFLYHVTSYIFHKRLAGKVRMDFMKTVTGRFRIAGIWEGVSLLLLIFIAMPLKYFADISSAVAVMGMIHGILFPLYLIALVHLAVVKKWKITRWLMGGLAGLLPFGTFVFESYLRKRDWK